MTISKSAKTSKASKTAKPAEIEFDGSDFPIPKKDAIRVRGARTHNLKNINLD